MTPEERTRLRVGDVVRITREYAEKLGHGYQASWRIVELGDMAHVCVKLGSEATRWVIPVEELA